MARRKSAAGEFYPTKLSTAALWISILWGVLQIIGLFSGLATFLLNL
jgi:hypothetical protein